MISRNVRTVFLGAALSLLVAGVACADEATSPAPAAPKMAAKPAAKATKAAPKADEVAVMETSRGRMVAAFWDKEAPKTVENFKKLARQGFYDGTGFHRIVKGFMIQGGDPQSKNQNAPNLGSGGPGYNIPDEFNTHQHVKGVLSMAHTSLPNSGGSQFFIMHGTSPGLDGQYTAFGHLIAGMDVLDKIANTPTGPNPSMPGENSKPMDWTTLKSVKIMSKAAYLAISKQAKKTEAQKPAEGKPAETKSSMGGGAGMDLNAGQGTPASSKSSTSGSSQASGHPGHDTVEKAKDATQPTTPPSSEGENQGGGESGK